MSASVSAPQTNKAPNSSPSPSGGDKAAQASSGVASRDFTPKWGDTVWGHVEKSLKDAGRLDGLSTADRNARIQRAVNEVKVLDKNGKEIPDKNLIYAGAKYRLVFPGAPDIQPPGPAPKRAGADGFRGSGSQSASGTGTNLTGTNPGPQTSAASGTSGVSAFGRTDAIASEIAMEAMNWNYQFEMAQQGRNLQQAYENAPNFEQTKTGVCTDMAFRAARMFEEKGIDARVVGGEIDLNSPAALSGGPKSADGKLQHSWVEYKGEDGKWRRFDPTAAALQKNANSALSAANEPWYGRPLEYMDNKGTVWKAMWAHEAATF